MADARLTISYRFDFGDMIRQLREAADRLEGLQDAVDGEATPPLQDAPEETPRLIKVDGILAEGDADTAREALRQMGADPHGLKTGMVVQSYVDHGDRKWVFRCWGTDDGCDGLLSLDHSSQSSAESARDRHIAEAHPKASTEQVGTRTDRDRIVDALRTLAQGHAVTRVWGRMDGSTPEQAQEGNAWAADVEDLADLVLRVIGRG